jgi:hypothetical protein
MGSDRKSFRQSQEKVATAFAKNAHRVFADLMELWRV